VEIEAIHTAVHSNQHIYTSESLTFILDQPSSLSVINNCVEGFISVFFVEKKSSFKRRVTE